MPTTTIAAPAGPRPLLSYLLLHHSTVASTLAVTLGRSEAQVRLALSRLCRRGVLVQQADRYEVASHRRAAVADYAEGAISLTELAGRRG